jgi:hypothetical protein
MAKDRLGKVRRSQVVTNYGPGAIVDFRAGGQGGAAVSVVAAGLEEWDRWAKPAGLLNPQCIQEPRLEGKLKVRGFRLPPVGRESDREGFVPLLPGVRFPQWLLCPKCDRLQQARKWGEDAGDPALYCARCSTAAGHRVHVVPIRFILACEHGHLDEFPWHHWVGHGEGCKRDKPLELRSIGAGLKGLLLMCPSCSAKATMDGAFSAGTMGRMGVKCAGRRPWLGPSEICNCPNPPNVVQRGASNIYFPATESALDIPPWSDSFQLSIGEQWANLVSADTLEDRDAIVRLVIFPNWEGKETLQQLQAKVRQRFEMLGTEDLTNLRSAEYRQMTSGEPTTDERSEFSIRPEVVPAGLTDLLEHLTRVVRLREVRAIYGFSRIHPPSGGFGDAQVAPLSIQPKQWLPAIEVRGEGIFLALDEEGVRKWEVRDDAMARAETINRQNIADWQARMKDDSLPPDLVTPRLMLVHTFSHAVMRQLSLECGYSTSSLRERLYVDQHNPSMCGVLIYTSTADADGTLGGLVRQGRAERMAALVRSAIEAMEWCSSDPLCMNGISSLSGGTNLAACHSCVLAPETACEHFNRFLDRAMLVGMPGTPDLGFFSRLLRR